MPEAVLFVDDEPAVLDGYKRMLYRDFTVHTAVGGPAGLAMMQQKGPFAVVVSDMRMPGMAGSEFLARARVLAPATVRMLLTGYSDLRETAAAVNDGNIAKYLNKPCNKDELIAALQSGVAQFRIAEAEKELLEGTLLGSIRTLSEILSAVSPDAFERSARISTCVRHLMTRTLLQAPWRAEAAAMLSQIGCLAFTSDILRAAHRGQDLSAEEQARYDRHPARASDLVGHIPRMDSVAWIIRHQVFRTDDDSLPGMPDDEMQDLRLAGEMLRLALEYDTLWLRGLPHAEIAFSLRQAVHTFPDALLDALETMKPLEHTLKPARLTVAQVQIDMIINEDVRNYAGALLVGAGQPVSRAILMKLREFVEDRRIADEICVLMPSA